MAHQPTSPERSTLFERTVLGMERRLEDVRRVPQMMSALAWGMKELDRALAETPADVRAQIACRAGCGSCCSVPVDVQAHEVFFAAQHIQLNFPPEDLEIVLERLAAHRQGFAALPPGVRELTRQPCALLENGSCTIYEGRPEICRAHHASDVTVCEAYEHDADVDHTKVYIPALRARMFAVMLGMDEALEGAGFDDRAYDFGSALHEALTDSRALPRWMRREAAFPDSCLVEPAAAS